MTYSSACPCAACLVARPLNAEITRLTARVDQLGHLLDKEARVNLDLLDDLDALDATIARVYEAIANSITASEYGESCVEVPVLRAALEPTE